MLLPIQYRLSTNTRHGSLLRIFIVALRCGSSIVGSERGASSNSKELEISKWIDQRPHIGMFDGAVLESDVFIIEESTNG
jgi:hypothetical protein